MYVSETALTSAVMVMVPEGSAHDNGLLGLAQQNQYGPDDKS